MCSEQSTATTSGRLVFCVSRWIPIDIELCDKVYSLGLMESI